MYFVNVEIKVYITDETDQFISELFFVSSPLMLKSSLLSISVKLSKLE